MFKAIFYVILFGTGAVASLLSPLGAAVFSLETYLINIPSVARAGPDIRYQYWSDVCLAQLQILHHL